MTRNTTLIYFNSARWVEDNARPTNCTNRWRVTRIRTTHQPSLALLHQGHPEMVVAPFDRGNRLVHAMVQGSVGSRIKEPNNPSLECHRLTWNQTYDRFLGNSRLIYPLCPRWDSLVRTGLSSVDSRPGGDRPNVNRSTRRHPGVVSCRTGPVRECRQYLCSIRNRRVHLDRSDDRAWENSLSHGLSARLIRSSDRSNVQFDRSPRENRAIEQYLSTKDQKGISANGESYYVTHSQTSQARLNGKMYKGQSGMGIPRGPSGPPQILLIPAVQ